MTALGDMLTPAHRIVGIGPEAIFYLHGVGGARTSFDAQIGAGGPGFAHIAWDMPGYGDSAALPEMTFAALAEAALRLIDALHIERAHLVGHSMGGMIAQELVASHPDRVASLVLSATSPAFGKAGGDWQQEFLAARLAPLDEGKTPADLAPAIVEALVADGHAMVTSTLLGGRSVLRLCTINPRTTFADIDSTLALLATLGARVAAP